MRERFCTGHFFNTRLVLLLGLLSGWMTQAASVRLTRVAAGLTSPVSVVPLADGRKLVVEQAGRVRLLDAGNILAPDPVLDVTGRLAVLKTGGFDERGLLDLALHPAFAENRRVFLTYSAPLREGGPVGFDSTIRLVEMRLPATEPLRIDPNSERILLAIDKPFANHNGGRIAFGPDGFLYVGVGDGGAANDRGRRPLTGNGQNLDTLLGKLLRLDVNALDGRGIPSDNPFADGKEGRPEIYAYGLRNAWGFSFDRGGTHELFAVDVGQNLFEELNRITRGGNYGWALREGFHGFDPAKPNDPVEPGVKTGARGEPLLEPLLEYRHPKPKIPTNQVLGLSVTGGYIYRGRALPELQGHYVFGDWSRTWAGPQGQLLLARRPADEAAGGRWSVETLAVTAPVPWTGFVVGFGQDLDGELWVMTSDVNGLIPGKGAVWKLEAAAP